MMEEWKSGIMEEWKGGMMEPRKLSGNNGVLDEWKVGKMEGWTLKFCSVGYLKRKYEL
jgi:hypothetical protein